MQLTKFTDYSLRVLIYLAHLPEGKALATIADISRDYEIPATHLMKVVHRLGQRGYIVTVRGKGGGMRLAKPPELINVGELIRDTEDNIDLVECFSSTKQDCPLLPACALKNVLLEARKSFLATLDFYSLSDIMGLKTPVRSHAVHLIAAPVSRKKKAAA
ncbi:MAG: Rrf2 family transcriptional regulator [Thiobacillus sp.]|jgi:Rrf2 family nitric oxide-sensitive transcriptional repressor|uniref:RrF2 family transcriptional regulator n=1 Tax=Thiobacillus sp. TaxID=924 RepID=UPI0028947984|nr:Rrf2 family transcriptional regulator [Thiobacillus sp.]MDT3705662.1 Rrf2 family transcriptional regulator [Thiobacillus sp.]